MGGTAEQASTRQRVEIAGVMVDRIDERGASAALEAFLRDGRSHQIVTVNVDFARLAQSDADFRALLNRADLAVADGMPIVWLSRLRRRSLPARISGIDLLQESCRFAARHGVPIYLLGAAEGVAESAGRALAARHPGLRIAATVSPPFGSWSAADEASMVDAIRAAGRCLLFVAFGAPRQDRFIAAHIDEIDTPIAMGVGCALDVIAGARRRAPRWAQRSGFEWLWRLLQEPRRLARRYLLQDLPLMLRLGAAAVRERGGREAA